MGPEHQEGTEGQHATARLHQRTLDRTVEDTPANGSEQKTKTENAFLFNADSGTAQELVNGGGMFFFFLRVFATFY